MCTPAFTFDPYAAVAAIAAMLILLGVVLLGWCWFRLMDDLVASLIGKVQMSSAMKEDR